jgi:hypothetical protein
MTRVSLLSLVLIVAIAGVGCGGDDELPDSGVRRDLGVVGNPDATGMDVVTQDDAEPADGGDATVVPPDGGDAAAPDADPLDADPIDGDLPDSTMPDGDVFDADIPDVVIGPGDAMIPDVIGPPLDAQIPDVIIFDAGRDTGVDSGFDAGDAGFDSGFDSGFDAGADAGVDAGADAGVDAGAGLDASTFTQGGGLLITEVAATSAAEWIELHNTTANAIALETYTISVFSHGTVALVIRAASDPNGTGTPISVAAGAYVLGVANPANAAQIPANAAFVIGTPGQLAADAFANTGDMITLVSPVLNGDVLDFRTAVTNPATPIGPTDYPLPTDVPLSLDSAADTTLGELLNDNAGVWCAQIFRGATPGAANRSCRAFVINELTYDYDSFTTDVDNGQEFVELAGPAGGSFANVVLTRIEGVGAAGMNDGEIAITGARMPLDGLYVIADDDPAGGPTQVANADQITDLVMEDGPDAVQLVRADTPAVLLDAFAYGSIQGLNDINRGLRMFEGFPAPDPLPDNYTINFARSDDAADTNNNSVDFRYDPSPTPGLRNGVSTFAFTSITPNDGAVGTTVTFVVTGLDFTDQMTVSFAQTPPPAIVCTAPQANSLLCSATFPTGASNSPERVDVTVAARMEHGGVSTLTQAFTWTTANNETNVPQECDYCNLQFPGSFTVSVGGASPTIYGQIYEAGLTDVTAGGPAPGVIAEVGYGPSGSDPRTSQWIWFATTFNVEVGNNDEYQATMTAPPLAGTYSYGYRYSLDGGFTWSYGDQDGSGSNGGLQFDVSQLGTMTVN